MGMGRISRRVEEEAVEKEEESEEEEEGEDEEERQLEESGGPSLGFNIYPLPLTLYPLPFTLYPKLEETGGPRFYRDPDSE